jgi:hypothetical protein
MSFDTLGLAAELLRAASEQGYREPTPIQRQAIPVVLQGRDILAGAQTGTGKTAGFTLPLLQRLHTRPGTGKRAIRALILTPTRELAAQVHESTVTYGKHLPLKSAVIFGGVNIKPQIEQLRRGVDILVATPGRLLDHAGQKTVDLSQVEILVLDEADRMLDMGFIHDIRKVLALLPKQRQNLLFSATYTDDIRKLADGLLHNPALIEVARRNTAAELVTQVVHPVDRVRKRELLSFLVGSNNWRQVLVFTRTKHGANRLAEQLGKDGISAAAIHGNKSQGARTRALADFASAPCTVSKRDTSRSWSPPTSRRAVSISISCPTWSTSNCLTCRRIMYTASAAPDAPAMKARPCRWCAWTRRSCCAISNACSNASYRALSSPASSPTHRSNRNPSSRDVAVRAGTAVKERPGRRPAAHPATAIRSNRIVPPASAATGIAAGDRARGGNSL